MTDRPNAFKSFIRSHYRSRGLHQSDLAAMLGVEQYTISRWLSGRSETPTAVLNAISAWLHLGADEHEWMLLAHDLLNAGERVSSYVELLEKDRFGNDICDQRIAKLRALLDELSAQRIATAHLRPLVYQPGERLALNTDADDESQDR